MKQHKPITVKITELESASWNYKVDDQYKEQKFLQSLKKNGLLYKMVVAQKAEEPANEKYEVCDGNHRLTVLKKAGIKTVEVYNMGRLTIAHRQRLGVELNEWTFEIDHLALTDVLNSINDEFTLEDMTITMPYDLDVLQSMIDMGKEAEDDFTEGNYADDYEEEVEPKGSKKTEVPEVILVFSDKDDFADFKEQVDYENGQHVNWQRVKQALTNKSDPLAGCTVVPGKDYLANTSSPF